MTFNSDNIVISNTGGSISFVVVYTDCSQIGNINAPSGSSWMGITIQSTASTSVGISITYSISASTNAGEVKVGNMVFSYEDDEGYPYSQSISAYQGSGIVIYSPIWKDIYYVASGTSTYDYSIRYEGEDIFFGRAYCSPSGIGARVNVNRVCASYLGNVIDFNEGVVDNKALKVFQLCDGNGVIRVSYAFICDYGSNWTGSTTSTLSCPINGHLDVRMRVLATLYNNNQRAINYRIDD